MFYLFLSSLRYLKRHLIQILLCILGITMGVAVVVGIDLARHNAETAFDDTVQTLQGKKSHVIVGGVQGIAEKVYRDLRVEGGFSGISPIVEGTVTVNGEVFYLLGLDPFSENGMKDSVSPLTEEGIGIVLTEPSIMLVQDVADRLNLQVGDFLDLIHGGQKTKVKLAGILTPTNPITQRQLQRLVVADIGTAQTVLNQKGFLTKIEVSKADYVSEIREFLKNLGFPDLEIISLQKSESTYHKMTRAFSLNLQAMSFLALLVGLFLIYNSMSFLIAQRKSLWGRLRMMGLKRYELLGIVLKEGALIGVIGTMLGIILGIFLSFFLTQLVTRAINDLYFVLKVTEIHVDVFTIVKAIILGMGGTLLASTLPALEAMHTNPQSMMRKNQSSGLFLGWLPLGSTFLMGLGYGVLKIWPESIAVGFISVFFILLGALGWIPFLVQWGTRLIRPLFRTIQSRMAIQDVTVHFHRSMIALASLVLAVSVSLGTTIMIKSFRQTVDIWLSDSLVSDVYVSAKSLVARRATTFIDPKIVESIRAMDGIQRINTYREYTVRSPLGDLSMAAVDINDQSKKAIRFLSPENTDEAWSPFFNQEAVIVSEPFAYHHQVHTGDLLSLMTEKGPHEFKVSGIYYDYGSDQGLIMMHRNTFSRYWNDDRVSSLGIILKEKDAASKEILIQNILKISLPIQEVLVRSDQDLLNDSMKIFDRTFQVTQVLRLLALLVAFLGILGALMALALEKSDEWALLRAMGFRPRDVFKLVVQQTLNLGFFAAVFSIPLGFLMSQLLIHVINKRSFGWTIHFHWESTFIGEAFLLSMIAAFISSLYPAYKMSRMMVIATLKGD